MIAVVIVILAVMLLVIRLLPDPSPRLTEADFRAQRERELPEAFPNDWLMHWEEVADDEWHLKWELHERLREFSFDVKIKKEHKELEIWTSEDYEVGDVLTFSANSGTFASRHTFFASPPNPINSVIIYGDLFPDDVILTTILGIPSSEVGDKPLLVAYTGERGAQVMADYHERKRLEAEQKRKDEEEYQRKIEEEEREEIRRKIKERHRRQELEKIIRQEMIDSGELYGDQPKRPPIPRDVVDAIYRRDGGKCVYCGSTQNLQLDHIIPFSRGGATTIENLQLLCQKCNLEKSNKIG